MYDPERRITAVQALEAPYFNQEQPPAAAPVGYVLFTLTVVVQLTQSDAVCRPLRESGTRWRRSESVTRSASGKRKVVVVLNRSDASSAFVVSMMLCIAVHIVHSPCMDLYRLLLAEVHIRIYRMNCILMLVLLQMIPAPSRSNAVRLSRPTPRCQRIFIECESYSRSPLSSGFAYPTAW